MRKQEEVRVCDMCKLRAVAEDTSYFGGHPFAGWFHVEMHGGLTDLESLRAQKEWDFCGKRCAINFFQGVPAKKQVSEDEEWWGDPSSGPGLGVSTKLAKQFAKALKKKKGK